MQLMSSNAGCGWPIRFPSVIIAYSMHLYVFNPFVTLHCSTLLHKPVLTFVLRHGCLHLPWIYITLLYVLRVEIDSLIISWQYCFTVAVWPLICCFCPTIRLYWSCYPVAHQPLSCHVTSNRLPSALSCVQACCHTHAVTEIHTFWYILGGALLMLLCCIGQNVCGFCMVVMLVPVLCGCTVATLHCVILCACCLGSMALATE